MFERHPPIAARVVLPTSQFVAAPAERGAVVRLMAARRDLGMLAVIARSA